MTTPPARLVALAAAALVFATAGPARAAGPATSRPAGAATRPAAWHAAIRPYVPGPDEFIARDEYDGPARAWLDSPGADLAAREGAFRFLITTQVFADALVGGGARPSDASRAFQVLMRLPDARAAFLDLFDRGGDVAKLYALCGLRELDPPAGFAARAAPFLKSDAAVVSIEGCVYCNNTVANVARGIAGGRTSQDLLFPYGRPATRPAR